MGANGKTLQTRDLQRLTSPARPFEQRRRRRYPKRDVKKEITQDGA